MTQPARIGRRFLCTVTLALVAAMTGCREEPTPRAIDVKVDPRIKRFEMTTKDASLPK